MNIQTNLSEEYVNFVDTTKKQNKFLWMFTLINLCLCTITFVFILSLYLQS